MASASGTLLFHLCSLGLSYPTGHGSYFLFFPSLQAAIVSVCHQIPMCGLLEDGDAVLTGEEGATNEVSSA